MAKRVSLKKDLNRKPVEKSRGSSIKIDTSAEAIQERAFAREYLPSVTYINSYRVTDRGREGETTVDLTDLVDKYPQNTTLIEQLIVGFNAIIRPGQSTTSIKTSAVGIRRFIEFLNSKGNLSNIYVMNIADINITVAQSFSNYLLNAHPRENRNRVWFSTIRRIVVRLKELYRNNPLMGKPFAWPFGPKSRKGITEGYHPRQMEELINACISDIKEIKHFHETFKMLNQELVVEEWTLENLMYYFQERLQSQYYVEGGRSPKACIKHMINGSKRLLERVENFGYTKDSIGDLYVQRGAELALSGRSPLATKISQHPDRARAALQFNSALATIKKQFPSFPYYYPIDEAKSSLIIDINHDDSNCDPLWGLILHALTYSCTKIDFMNGRLGKMAVYAAKHFVTDTIYPFFALCMANTGWNPESLFSISDDVDAHITPDLIDPENYVIIIGLKYRGQASDKPKLVFHRSPKNKMYSTYSLLKYVESIIAQYKDSEYYQKGYLWQYTVPENVPHIVINTMLTNLGFMSRQFIERHRFKHIPDTSIDHRKIRSGYVTLRQLFGATERKLSEDLEHESKETIIYYTSDESSNMVQDIRIKQIQEQFVKDITNFKVRIVESQSLQDLRKAINDAKTQKAKEKVIKKQANKLGLSEKTIIHLLDAGSEKYILACENARNPSWPGFEKYVKEGQNCRYFNKCALCTQSVVFPEALPYIARRIMELEKLQSRLSSTDWILQYGYEFDAWKQILNSWKNQEQVNDAWGQARIGKVVLPQIMRGV